MKRLIALLTLITLLGAHPMLAAQKGTATPSLTACHDGEHYAVTLANSGQYAGTFGYSAGTSGLVILGTLQPGQRAQFTIAVSAVVIPWMQAGIIWYPLDYPPYTLDLATVGPCDPTAPGCDQFLPLEHTQTITLWRDAPIYWQGSIEARTPYIIPAGSTARARMTNNPDFVPIFWACDPVWIERSAVR